MPSIISPEHVTVDGYSYRVVATDLPEPFPVAILVNNEIVRLTSELKCPSNDGYSLVQQPKVSIRFINVYRAADGGICFGSSSYTSDEERRSKRDSQRALFGMRVEYDETTGRVKADKA